MSVSDDYRLTRRDHQTSLAGCIQEETEFHDVSLACEDQQVRAHKVVLAASSIKLRHILLSNPHPQPLIYLSGVQFSILEKIIDTEVLLHSARCLFLIFATFFFLC